MIRCCRCKHLINEWDASAPFCSTCRRVMKENADESNRLWKIACAKREAEIAAGVKRAKPPKRRPGPGKFWARSCAEWYLNSRFVVGSAAYDLTHGR